jgi:putative spermidine/putrescine transport system substrate-binding protein
MYNSDIIKEPPKSYEILWDPKYRGKVAVPPSNNQGAPKLIIAAALLAGGSQQNPDPGFKKLKELKPNVHSFTEDYSIQAELMRQGEIVLMFDALFAVQPFMMKGYPIKPSFDVKEGIFITPDIVAMVKGHPGPREVAEAFINTALSVDAQVGMAADLGYGPTNKRVEITDPRIDPKMRPYILTSEHFGNRIPVDPSALAKVRQDWITRYDEALKG